MIPGGRRESFHDFLDTLRPEPDGHLWLFLVCGIPAATISPLTSRHCARRRSSFFVPGQRFTMAAKRILLIDDDAHFAALLLFVLQGLDISLILPSRWLKS
jgi:hypothetical protein